MRFKIFHKGFGKNHVKNISISKVNAKKVSPTVHILLLYNVRHFEFLRKYDQLTKEKMDFHRLKKFLYDPSKSLAPFERNSRARPVFQLD
jgi:hypothetical protein